MGFEDSLIKAQKVTDPVDVNSNSVAEKVEQKVSLTEKQRENERDKELVDILKGSDDEELKNRVLGEIITHYRQKVFNFIFPSILSNKSDAEEVTWQTFFNAQRAIKSFRGESAFSSWLLRIAQNCAKNRLLREVKVRKSDRHISWDQPLNDENDLTLGETISSEAESPSSEVATEELIKDVADKIEQLSDSHREIFTLRYLLHKSYEEMAALLGIGVGTVKSRLARARESLRALLAEKYPELALENGTKEEDEGKRIKEIKEDAISLKVTPEATRLLFKRALKEKRMKHFIIRVFPELLRARR